MKDDVRYSEFLFLRALERDDKNFEHIWINDVEQQKIVGFQQGFYMQMVIALAEDGYIEFNEDILRLLIGRLRGEIGPTFRYRREFTTFNGEISAFRNAPSHRPRSQRKTASSIRDKTPLKSVFALIYETSARRFSIP
jgi:hypothetical protein